MQHRHMERIDDVLEMLQPVARNDRRPAAADRGIVGLDEFALVHRLQAIVARQHRLLLRRSHVGEDQAVVLFQRIPGLAHLVPEAAAVRLARLLQAMAGRVELPAVVAAADAVVLDLAIIERGAAMTAARMQQPRPALAVAKQDEVFAERAHLARRIAGIGGKSDRVPVAAQQLAHRLAASDLDQLGAVARRFHLIGGVEVNACGGRAPMTSLPICWSASPVA